MSQEGRPQSVATITARAAQLPAHERSRYLDEACGGDEGLRSQVERALQAHEAATMVGDEAGPGSAASPPPPPARGLRAKAAAAAATDRWFGQYRILRALGEGGMGLVYLAEQQTTSQLVALKLVRPGLASPRLLRRFEQEVRTLGLLRHPGIARIYDAGTHDAGFGEQPFFAMEYIEGLPLTEHAKRNALDLRARLELLASVCHAVHHAHTKGVIHRDLKPSNILVDAQGAVKVLDFGVARAVEADDSATMRTEAGQLVGTLPYMSPEQLAGDPGDLDTRSDVYALGVVMYELLSGSLPHDLSSSSLVEAVRIVSERDPAPLSTRDLDMPADVRTICMKALERDRERRYQSASDLAGDIERFLRDEPIAARAPSALYLMTKFARRNRALVAGGAAVLVALAAGIVGTTYMAIRATIQRDRAVVAEMEAEHARRIAEEDAATAKAISGYLTEMLRSADPERALGREVTVRDALDTAAATLDGVFEEQPTVEAEARHTMGSTYMALGAWDAAEPQLVRAHALFLEHHGPDSRDTLNATRSLAKLDIDLNRYAEAEAKLADASERLTRLFGADDPDAVECRAEMARVYIETGRMEEGERIYREVLETYRRTLAPDDPTLLTASHNFSSTLRDLGRLQEAQELFTETLARRRAALGDQHPLTLYSVNSLAAIKSRLGEAEEAEALFRQALIGREKVLGEQHPAAAVARQNLANQLMMMGNLSEAAPLTERAYEVFRTHFGEEHPRTILAVNSLGYLNEELGNLAEAERYYRKALELTRSIRGLGHPETFAPLNNLASLLQRIGKSDEAAAQFEELLRVAGAALPESHYILAIFRNNYGDCLRELGRFREAEPILLSSRETLMAALGEAHARIEKATRRLVALYEAMGDAAKADEWRGRLPAPDAP